MMQSAVLLCMGGRTGFLVYLDGGLVAIDANNFANQSIMANLYQLVHGHANHVLGDDDGSLVGIVSLLQQRRLGSARQSRRTNPEIE